MTTSSSPRSKSTRPATRPVRIAQRKSFNECWREAVARAGLPKGTRFHDLRNFYASELIKANLNPKVIQTRLDHATIAETMDTDGHLFPDQDDLGRGAIDALLLPKGTEQAIFHVAPPRVKGVE